MSAIPSNVDPLEAMLELDHPRKLAARDWAQQHLPATPDRPDGWVVDRQLWKEAAAFGIQGLMSPVSHGGTQSSAVDTALTFEGLGSAAVDNGVVFALASQTLAVQRAIGDSGTADQLDRWMSPLVAGEVFGSFAMSEPESGSDPWGISTTAVEQPDGSFVLNGIKRWATLGPICDVALVFAMTNPDARAWGVTAFIVDSSLPGFTRTEAIPKSGLRSCPFGEIHLDDCRVGADAVLGSIGSGAAIFSRIIEAERAFLYAWHLGSMQRVLEMAVDRARSRVQGGVHIGSHQAVSHRIVDIKLKHESARMLLYKAAALHDRDDAITMASALAKLAASDLGVDTPLDAIRVFGAAGFTTEVGLEAELRDGLAGLSFSGTTDVTRNIAGAMLGLNRKASGS